MRTNQQIDAHSHARTTRESVRTMVVALADVISLLEQDEDELGPEELEDAVERLRRARVTVESALRDTQEHVDRVLDAIKPVVAIAPYRLPVSPSLRIAERRAARGRND